MQQNKTIRIFLGSSITELENERLKFANYINNTVAPILEKGGWSVHLFKCEDDPSPNFGGSSQKTIDNELLQSDISVFLFKKKAGEKTIREYDLARKLQLQGEKKHGIYVYCFDVPESEKSPELIAFQQRLTKDEHYWHPCKDIDSLESHFLPGLLTQLLGEKEVSIVDQHSDSETDGDSRFKEYKDNEEKQAMLREKLHQDIEGLLKQIKVTIGDESINIAVRITKVIELYKKADRWAEATAYDKKKYSDLLFNYARFLLDYGLYRDAESIYLRQIPLAEELDDAEHEDTAASYNNIGSVYWKQGEYSKALEYYQKALAIKEKVLGTEHSSTATTYNNIGTVYYDQGDYGKALDSFHKVSEIFEKVLGTEHPSTATSYNNIGMVYKEQGDYGKALEYYQKALAIREKVLGTEHPDTATSYNNIGLVYYAQGNYGKALEYYQKALAIKEKVLGMEHPSTATSYNNIGAVYDDQGDYVKALEYYQKAMEIDEKVLGKEHPGTATDYNNIGVVYKAQGDYDKALEYYQKALEIDEKVLGKEHPGTATDYNNIGTVYYKQGDYQKALEYFDKAYSIFEKVLGPQHPNTKTVMESISIVKQAMNPNG